MTSQPNVVVSRVLVRLYPGWWRARYGDELAEVLIQQPVSWAVAVDVARGALDARLHPIGDPRRSTMDSIRRRSTTMLCAFATFCLAGSALAKLGEDEPVHAVLSDGATAWSWRLIVAGAAIAGTLALVACMALASAFAGRRARNNIDRAGPMVGLALAGLIAMPLAAAGYARLVGEAPTRPDGVDAWLTLLGLVVIEAGLLTLVLVSGVVAVRRIDVAAPQLRLAGWAAVVASVGMAWCTLAAIVWGLAVRADRPAVFAGSNGFVRSSLASSWLVVVVTMLACTVVAVRAAAGTARTLRSGDLA